MSGKAQNVIDTNVQLRRSAVSTLYCGRKKEVRSGRVYIQRLHEALKVKNALGGTLLLEQTFGLVM